MRIVAISDTHNQQKKIKLPEGDILIHAGDATSQGSLVEVNSFLVWMGAQPFLHKIFVAGNHDWLFERNPLLARQMCEDNGVTWLQDQSVIIDGLKFYGSAYQPEFCNWAFNLPRGPELAEVWSRIPDDTDVLVTHGPVMGILDELVSANGVPNGQHVGCHDLADRIKKLNVKVHVCGHIHAAYGMAKVGKTKFYNAALLDEYYNVANEPWEIEI